MKNLSHLSLLASFAVILSGCSTTKQPYSGERISNAPHNMPQSWDGAAVRGSVFAPSREVAAKPVESRPGLGTKWGEHRNSKVAAREFSRGGKTRPWATAKFFYNDEEGAKAMANTTGFAWRRTGAFSAAKGALEVGLKKGGGGFLRSFSAEGDWFFAGEKGDRYVIWMKNKTKAALEVVVSVDGLDVLDGNPASYKRRGYLVHPGRTLTIDGFRENSDSVAAFRFSSVSNSYAERRHGNSRNVGVVGIAVFPENGHNPLLWRDGLDVRIGADPFPREFATPPE